MIYYTIFYYHIIQYTILSYNIICHNLIYYYIYIYIYMIEEHCGITRMGYTYVMRSTFCRSQQTLDLQRVPQDFHDFHKTSIGLLRMPIIPCLRLPYDFRRTSIGLLRIAQDSLLRTSIGLPQDLHRTSQDPRKSYEVLVTGNSRERRERELIGEKRRERREERRQNFLDFYQDCFRILLGNYGPHRTCTGLPWTRIQDSCVCVLFSFVFGFCFFLFPFFVFSLRPIW